MPYILGFAMFMIACGIVLPKATGEFDRHVTLLLSADPATTVEFALTSYIFFWVLLAGAAASYIWAHVSSDAHRWTCNTN
jgi:hypothetical protein